MGFRIRYTTLLIVALVLAVLASFALIARNAAAHQATLATLSLQRGAPGEALRQAESALAWNPSDPGATYSRLVALKQLGRWDDLAAAARGALAWHADRAALLQLAGEADWRGERLAGAAEALWDTLWRLPSPPETPAQVWRVAMLSAQKAWGAGDRRVIASAVRTLNLLDRDVTMNDPAIRRETVADAAAALRNAGAPLTAQAAAKK